MAGAELELRLAWDRHLGTGAVARRWFESVTNRYREPHRRYHDLRHVAWVVRHVESLSAGDAVAREHPDPDSLRPDPRNDRDSELDLDPDPDGLDLDATIAAAFFHDAVYDPTAPDNEAASGRLAVVALTELGWSEDRVDHVDRLIRGTAHHRVENATPEAAVLFAADLAVLAAQPAPYSDYVRNVRHEYGHVSDGEWRVGRARVLKAFLDRPTIYAPTLRLGTWERRARANLTAELEALAEPDQ